MSKGIGGHQLPVNETHVWLTPPEVLITLGTFALDPCACAPPRPWPTAWKHYSLEEGLDGLVLPWFDRVFCNPPYGGPTIVGPWMRKMAEHGNGIALVFARTETAVFQETVFRSASAVLFIEGRLYFHHSDGTRADNNSGAPSCLIAYGQDNVTSLERCGLPGSLIYLGGAL